MSEAIHVLGREAPVAIVKSPIRVYADGLVIETLQAIEWDIDFRSGLVTGWMRFVRFDGKESFTPIKWHKKTFNLRFTATNEYGAAMWMEIGSVKFLTCQSGSSIDDIVIEETAIFEAPFSEFTEWTPYQGQVYKIQKIESALADVHFYLNRLKDCQKGLASELPPNP